MYSLISHSLDQLLAAHCNDQTVRTIEAAAQDMTQAGRRSVWAPLWSELESNGFADALMPEAKGGAELALAALFVIADVCGRHVLPLPLVHTCLARYAVDASGGEVPQGSIAIAERVDVSMQDGQLCAQVPFGLVADWVLLASDGGCRLLSVANAAVVSRASEGSLDAVLSWPLTAVKQTPETPTRFNSRAMGALANAGLLAGAMTRVMELSLNYANERVQFGKPIGKFQVIQQQLSVMAEEVYLARMAAQLGCAGALDQSLASTPLALCAAKCECSAMAPKVAAIAHAIHGAIGFTDEYALQLYTRRLHEWRLGYGAESYWGGVIGEGALASPASSALDMVLSAALRSEG